MKNMQCYDQLSYVQHAEITQNDHFFPYNELLQQYGLAAVTLAGIVFAGFLAYIFVAIVDPAKYNRVNNPRYPWRALSVCHVLGGITLIGAGTAELFVVLDLMNTIDLTNDGNDHDDELKSPICNVEYSTCHLGLGGRMAASGIACCYVGALLAFYATFIMVRTQHRESKEDERRIQQTYLGDTLS